MDVREGISECRTLSRSREDYFCNKGMDRGEPLTAISVTLGLIAISGYYFIRNKYQSMK